MADIADQSDAHIEAAREAALRAVKRGPFHGYTPTGFCAWCGDPVLPGRIHCRPLDNDCEAVHLKFIRFRHGEE